MPQVFLERSVASSSGLFRCTRLIVIYRGGCCYPKQYKLLLRLPWCIVENMLGRVISVSIVLATVILALILQTSTPSNAGPVGILIVFLLMYVLVLGVATFVLYWGSRVWSRLVRLVVPRRPVRALTLVRSYYFSSVIGLAPVIFVGMQSVGEVGFYDVLLVVLFVSVACFYIAKRTA